MAITYATSEDVAKRLSRTFTESEKALCESLLEDAALIIDSVAPEAKSEAKKTVSCRMAMRAIGSSADLGIPVGASQGSMSALGYSQSWTINSGAVGELYLAKLDKQLLGMGGRIGSRSPVESLAVGGGDIECAALM